MCGRFNITDSPLVQVLLDELDIDIGPLPVRYNVCPTDPTPILTAGEGYLTSSLCRWGLVPPDSEGPDSVPLRLHARAESIHWKDPFREPFKTKRCAILASSFIEPNRETNEYHECFPTEFAFMFAGVWDCWKGNDGEEIYTYSIIMSEPPDSFLPVHPRMPVTLTVDEMWEWLNPGADRKAIRRFFRPELRQPYKVFPIGKKLLGVRIKEPMEPVGEPFIVN